MSLFTAFYSRKNMPGHSGNVSILLCYLNYNCELFMCILILKVKEIYESSVTYRI